MLQFEICEDGNCKEQDCDFDGDCEGEDLICQNKKCRDAECIKDGSSKECDIGKICYNKRCEIACSVHDSCPEVYGS